MKMKRLFFILLSIFPYISFSQDGTLDPSFGNNGFVYTDFFERDDYPIEIALQSDAKIIVLGKLEFPNNYSSSFLVRYLANGEIDLSFGTNGVVDTDINTAKSLIVQEDDKMIVGSSILGSNGKDFLIKRYLPDGSLDTNFGEDGIVITDVGEDVLKEVLLQTDGKIIAYGGSKINEQYFITISRYLTTGVLDNSFGTNGIVTSYLSNDFTIIQGGLIKENGKIIALITKTDNDDYLLLMQYNGNGSLDPSFGEDGIKNLNITNSNLTSLSSIIETSTGKILLAYSTFNSITETALTKLIRLTENGDWDLSFGNSGLVSMDDFYPTKIIIQENNRIIVGGRVLFWEGTSVSINRFYENGNIDTTFTEIFEPFELADFILQNDGKILWVGNTYPFQGQENFVLAQYNNSPLGIEYLQLQNFTIHPNPSNGIFKITHDAISSETPYQITDITGKIMQTGKLSGEQTSVNLSEMKSGVYLLTASGSTLRLIKN